MKYDQYYAQLASLLKQARDRENRGIPTNHLQITALVDLFLTVHGADFPGFPHGDRKADQYDWIVYEYSETK